MTCLILLKRANGQHEGDPIAVNPTHIVAVEPHWDDSDLWTHCTVHLAGGVRFDVNAIVEEIQDAIDKAQTAAAKAAA